MSYVFICCVSRPRRRLPEEPLEGHLGRRLQASRGALSGWSLTHGVNTHGAVAKVMFFLQIVEEGSPWHFSEDKSRLTGVPKKSYVKRHNICSDPISADPICPSPRRASSRRRRARRGRGAAAVRSVRGTGANRRKDTWARTNKKGRGNRLKKRSKQAKGI